MEWLLYSWPMLILLGLGLRMALRLNYGARGPEPDDPVYVLLNITGWVLIGLGLAPAIVGGIFTFFGTIIVLLAAATLVEGVTQRREAQRRSMCTLLSLLVGRGIQLESSVLMAGQSMRGIVGRSAERLFNSLQQGTPLAAAVARHPAALPREATSYLSAGQTAEARLAALKELSRGEHGEMAAVWRACVDRLAYLGAVMFMMVGVLAFLMIKIVPEFRSIFYEFEISLPAMTELAVAVSQFFVNYAGVPLVWALMLVMLGTLVVSISYLCDVPVLSWVGDRLFRGRRVADVLRILAIATDQRQPLAGVLDRLAAVYPSPGIRRQLAGAAETVSAGGDWRDALHKVRLITSAELSLLKTAEQVGNLPWALRAIAGRREKRSIYRLAIALQLLYPAAILMLGAVVAFFVISLFIPIVVLIRGLT